MQTNEHNDLAKIRWARPAHLFVVSQFRAGHIDFETFGEAKSVRASREEHL